MIDQLIPTVDLKQYTDGDEHSRQAFVQSFGEAMREFGFAILDHHGVEQSLVDKNYALWAEFFSREDAYKRTCEDASTGRQRGYTSFGVEHAKNNAKADLKEFYHIGRALTQDHPLYTRVVANIWPEGMDELKDSTMALFDSMERCSMILLEVMSRYLDQDPNLLPDMAQDGSSILRVIHYPVCDGFDEPGVMRAAQHEDINLMTLLPTATQSGLELLTRDNQWVPIHATPGQIIVDTGDMMSRLTNTYIPATTHRVVNPEGAPEARYSMPFFVHPHPDASLAVLPSCVPPGEEPKFAPITSEEFLMERLREIGLKK